MQAFSLYMVGSCIGGCHTSETAQTRSPMTLRSVSWDAQCFDCSQCSASSNADKALTGPRIHSALSTQSSSISRICYSSCARWPISCGLAPQLPNRGVVGRCIGNQGVQDGKEARRLIDDVIEAFADHRVCFLQSLVDEYHSHLAGDV